MRRRARALHRDANYWYLNGLKFDYCHGVTAPEDGPMRIAFDAGRADAEVKGSPTYGGMLPLDVWQSVLADWLRRGTFGIVA